LVKFITGIFIFIPILTLKGINNLNSYIGILEIPRIRIGLNRTLVFITFLFIYISVKPLINSNSPNLLLILILIHLLAFLSKDIIIVLLLSDLILCWITLRFGLYHTSLKELVSNIYLIYYVILPSAPLLFLVLLEWSKRKSSSTIVTYRNDFLFYSNNNRFMLMVILSGLAKLPIFRLHYWLPKAHVQAPTILSIVLARLSLKVGLVVSSFILYYSTINILFLKILICFLLTRLIISVYIRISATDSKVFLAYCSVSHMSVRAIGICLIISDRFTRAWLLRLRHCLSSPLLFYISRNSQYSLITRIIIPYKRIKINKISILLLIILLIDLPFPPIFSFWREVTILQSLASTFRMLSCFILPSIVMLIRRYEYIYVTLREFICSSLYVIYISSFFIIVFRNLIR